MSETLTVQDLKDHADRLSGLLAQKKVHVRRILDPEARDEMLHLISALEGRVAEISAECEKIMDQTATAAV